MSKTETAATAALLVALAFGGWWLMDIWLSWHGLAAWDGRRWAVTASGRFLVGEAWPVPLRAS